MLGSLIHIYIYMIGSKIYIPERNLEGLGEPNSFGDIGFRI